ncbi:hypothetical protein PANDA_007386 [Ailuropoda melanoleuca]|uniref:Uncharacterized protein n=1 Tax=Ailuropoda melanoleuca TaxID=9646 RepID=D2HAE0_AILME|nr:hypothetical protein PANDA_007386 [Ailuropoda melanoleuca]
MPGTALVEIGDGLFSYTGPSSALSGPQNVLHAFLLMLVIRGVAVLEGPMYAVGGHDGWSYLNTVERWDPQARQWNFVATMSTPRSTVGVAVLSGNCFIFSVKTLKAQHPKTTKFHIHRAFMRLSFPHSLVALLCFGGFLFDYVQTLGSMPFGN